MRGLAVIAVTLLLTAGGGGRDDDTAAPPSVPVPVPSPAPPNTDPREGDPPAGATCLIPPVIDLTECENGWIVIPVAGDGSV